MAFDDKRPIQQSVLYDSSGNPVAVALDGSVYKLETLSTLRSGVVSSLNESSTPLGAGASYTGTAEEVTEFASVTLNVFSDVSSAVDGLKIQFSSDGTNWDIEDTFSIVASSGKVFTFGPAARYFRAVYVNGSTPQTAFRLQVLLHRVRVKPSTHPVAESIDDATDAEMVKAIATGKTFAGTYANIAVTPIDGHGAQMVEQIDSAIARGQIPGAQLAQAHGFVSVTVASTVPIRQNPYTEPTSAAQRSISSTSASDTAVGTGARVVRIIYFDGSMNGPFTEDITLNGTTAVNTVATDMQFIESIEVIETGSFGFNLGSILLQSGTGGAGPTIATISPGFGATFWAHHYVPGGKRAVIRNLFWGMSDGDDANIWLRYIDPTNTNTPFRYKTAVYRIGSNSPSQTHPLDPPLVVVGPARVEMVVDFDTAVAGVVLGGFGFYEV